MSGYGPCTTVEHGGVGESGESTLLHHEVGGPTSKMMVLRTVDSNLCPNTGAAAILVVDGQPGAHGVITDTGSSIQVEAEPGANVIAIVHTIPLFNEITCIRLGELEVELQECDLVN